MSVGALSLAAKPAKNRDGIGLGRFRMQLGRGIPNGENRPSLFLAIVLDAAVAARGLSRMPIGPAIVDAGTSCHDRNCPVKARCSFLSLNVPPKVLCVSA